MSFFEILALCGGYYKATKSPGENFKTPLVAYAGTYGDEKKRYVGETYANCAAFERQAGILLYLAEQLDGMIHDFADEHPAFSIESFTGFCGAPEGGKSLAVLLASLNESQYIYPEKKVRVLEAPGSRERSDLIFGRHVPNPGDQLIIVEDVVNNFSTTASLVESIQSYGATVVAIVCLLNRSLHFHEEFLVPSGQVIPVIALHQEEIPEYQQDDPYVSKDIEAGNIVWDPKKNWDELVPEN